MMSASAPIGRTVHTHNCRCAVPTTTPCDCAEVQSRRSALAGRHAVQRSVSYPHGVSELRTHRHDRARRAADVCV